MILPCHFDKITTLGRRYVVCNGKRFGVYNQYGSVILPCNFEKIECLDNGQYLAVHQGNKQLYNAYGSLLENRINTKVIFSTEN